MSNVEIRRKSEIGIGGAESNCAGSRVTEGEDWERLLRDTEEFAELQIDRLYWRGRKKGVLPDGYDASSIAAEAVREVLQEQASAGPEVKGDGAPPSEGETENTRCSLNPDRNGGLASLRGGREFQWRLNRRVLRIVGRLNHRKEAKAMRNDLDLPLQPLSNCGQGEIGTTAESLPTPDAEWEWTAEEDEGKLDRLKREVAERLGADRHAKAVFECMCRGVLRNAKIGEALGMKEEAVKRARRRIKRRIAEVLGRDRIGGVGLLNDLNC